MENRKFHEILTLVDGFVLEENTNITMTTQMDETTRIEDTRHTHSLSGVQAAGEAAGSRIYINIITLMVPGQMQQQLKKQCSLQDGDVSVSVGVLEDVSVSVNVLEDTEITRGMRYDFVSSKPCH